ncbi:hypothetical protein [Paenibacillus sp. sgz302251]|uniref:hypothetical protein n=1 Tax=Paenibacillus sp. sgz302251 TaxID=3414493 RepID=UPI003C7BD3EF
MNDKLGYSQSIYYYNEEGKVNIDNTIDLVIERAVQNEIKKVLVFTTDGVSAIKLKDLIVSKGHSDIEIIAVAFPQHFTVTVDIEGEKQKINPPTSDRSVKDMLQSKSIPLVQGIMAFEDIIIPGVRDIKLNTIEETLSLFSGGLKLCIEAILMSCDSGYIEQNEEVISMSADTAIVATACKKQWLFHPSQGLEIKELICKPRKFTISKKKN